MIDSATCRANAAEAAAFAATLTNPDVRLFWDQTALDWMEKARAAELQERPSPGEIALGPPLQPLEQG